MQAQGEHPTAIQERIHSGRGPAPDTQPPSITMVSAKGTGAEGLTIRARVHDRKSPSLSTEWRSVTAEWTIEGRVQLSPMRWYGEYLWRADLPASVKPGTQVQVCAIDAAGTRTCQPLS